MYKVSCVVRLRQNPITWPLPKILVSLASASAGSHSSSGRAVVVQHVAAAADHSTQQGIVVTLDQLRNGGPLRLVQTGAHSAAQNGLDALPVSGSGEARPRTGGVQQLADNDGSGLSVTLHHPCHDYEERATHADWASRHR